MISLGTEPEGLLLRRADVFAWLPGLDREQWLKIRPHLSEVKLPGCKRPYYAREEIRAKLVEPMLRAHQAASAARAPSQLLPTR